MADTTFTDKKTIIEATWLNEVNNLVHKIFGNPTYASQAIAIDGSGNVGIGTSSPASDLHLHVPATASSILKLTNQLSGETSSDGFDIEFRTALDVLFNLRESSKMVFLTANTERMRIESDGEVLVGKTTPAIAVEGIVLGGSYVGITGSGSIPVYINRHIDDGDLVEFRQDNIDEGSISVSGTTVSYNGAHLSRWSQWEDGPHQTRPEILRGTVLSNRDEMCVWLADEWTEVIPAEYDEDGNITQEEQHIDHHELYDGELQVGDTYTDEDGNIHTIVQEDNEQLNKVVVSDVAGDKDVAGVFQGYDEDDLYAPYDFYVAQTGDFVIRIAQGTTVQRGDLLISAGDGTAKPQDDNIVRSSTIAKVTSTTVAETYNDGSYLVPCVLMVC